MTACLALVARVERWPVAGAFTISRGAKTYVDVIVVELSGGGATGRGEATPIYYHGETAESVIAQLQDDASPENLLTRLPRGAARNALDSALWDWRAKFDDTPAWAAAGLFEPRPLITAFTISLGEPAKMEADARAASGKYSLLKLKLSGEGDTERVAAVREGAPDARLIVDANEAWGGRDIAAQAAALVEFGVELIEQPVPAGADHLLDGIVSPIPLCADESCQDRADLARCTGRYAAINVKLDKTGGLTEALALIREAEAIGLRVMVGCMLSTSLGVAPAFLAAQSAEWVDLDGPLLLAQDRDDGFKFAGGTMYPSAPALWG